MKRIIKFFVFVFFMIQVVTDNVMVDVQNKQSQETSTNAAETKVEETNSVVENVCPTCGEKKLENFV